MPTGAASGLCSLIFCGGEGKRLGVWASNRPKPLVPIVGKSVLIRNLQGIARVKSLKPERVIVSISHGEDIFRNELSNWRDPLGIRIDLVSEGDNPIGGGAALLKILREEISDSMPEWLSIQYGDAVPTVSLDDLLDRALETNSKAAMAVSTQNDSSHQHNCFISPEGSVKYRSNRSSVHTHTDAGLILIRSIDLLRIIRAATSEEVSGMASLPHFLEFLSNKMGFAFIECQLPSLDIGDPKKLVSSIVGVATDTLALRDVSASPRGGVMEAGTFYEKFFSDVIASVSRIAPDSLEMAVDMLANCRKDGGRVFVAGVGGSAANASHAAADLRKLTRINALCLTDNTAEVTAVTNDFGWTEVFDFSMGRSHFDSNDLLLVFSVGGGSIERGVSLGLVKAIDHAHAKGGKVISVVGKNDGYAASNSDCVIFVASTLPEFVTPVSESLSALIWHYFASHPILQEEKTVW